MRFAHLYGALFGWRVQSGPFRGLRYLNASIGSALAPKLLGTYERELSPWVKALRHEPFDLIINVGAAEGYYAVGFARSGRAPVIAFEADAIGRALIARLAVRNGVGHRVEIAGACEPADLSARLAAAERPLVIMDVEGYETTLLDPVAVPRLRRAVILVEVHEDRPATADLLQSRFNSTHEIAERRAQPRHWADLPRPARLLGLFARQRFLAAMDERRPAGMRWWLLRPVRAS